MGGLIFAKDSDGNYGYKVAGADTVTPFKQGAELIYYDGSFAKGWESYSHQAFSDAAGYTGGYQIQSDKIDLGVTGNGADALIFLKQINLGDYVGLYVEFQKDEHWGDTSGAYVEVGVNRSTTLSTHWRDVVDSVVMAKDNGTSMSNLFKYADLKNLTGTGFVYVASGRTRAHIYKIFLLR